ncbi:HDIG domain-containing protein [Clostridium tagluense]|uniref:HD domain-containing protein n=1 Tax=Clostridium tagluense TaxID=360422 RepID=UPI001C0C28B8|nr:HD domain-containing protein [Clostridium tagluense]MBU3128127.1 HDIG domain-containing protein [Clostridium tagluense]MCB2311736.1 HDIG domain-containing protein [Clostridium tagluense]MCB2316542.1 HDIG domain-containing protein [Clostridium tagluense]MCB2321316.1 HDIG domain-containing protein [Clostridium tagluense]MCB2326411.1 HDIG domain-containing protein [Clostridium tagluense]
MKKMFEEFEKHLMEDEKPSIYFNKIISNESIFTEYPYTLLSCLVETDQSPEHHPEGNVWIHTMLVVDNAAKVKALSENPRAFMWGALLHDLGKAPTTKIRKGKITSYDHDTVGADLCRKFLGTFTEEEEFIKRVTALVRWHMQTLFVMKDLPFGDVKGMAQEISIKEIALLSECDRLGRGELSKIKIKEEKENIKAFIRKCEKYLDGSK